MTTSYPVFAQTGSWHSSTTSMRSNPSLFFFLSLAALVWLIVRRGLARTAPKPRPSTEHVQVSTVQPCQSGDASKDFQSNRAVTLDLAVSVSSIGASPTKAKRLPPLELTYTNTQEITNKRVIQPYRTRANTDYFEAYCHFEDQHRSFRFDRVSCATNLQTGEILSQSDLYVLIHPKRKPPDWLEVMPILKETTV